MYMHSKNHVTKPLSSAFAGELMTGIGIPKVDLGKKPRGEGRRRNPCKMIGS